MRIALVHRVFTRAGGVEKNVVLLARGLAARGHEIHVFCHKAEIDAPAGVTLRHVPVLRAGMALRYLSFARNAARALATERFDVVQGFDLTLKQDVLRVGRGLMKVYREVLAPTRSAMDRLWRTIDPESRALQALERRMLRPGAWKRIVAISEGGKRELIAAYGIPADAIEVIPNGVDLAAYSPEKAAAGRAETRARLGIHAADRVVLFVGTGFRRKGLATLIDAMPEVPGARLVVVGRDGAMREYERQARGRDARVLFAGEQRADAALYGAADVVVLPTRYEPFGNVVLEALACGIPAVVTAAAGASDVYATELGERVVADATDSVALAAAIRAALAKPQAAVCRGIAERYPEDACVARYEALYQRMLGIAS